MTQRHSTPSLRELFKAGGGVGLGREPRNHRPSWSPRDEAQATYRESKLEARRASSTSSRRWNSLLTSDGSLTRALRAITSPSESRQPRQAAPPQVWLQR